MGKNSGTGGRAWAGAKSSDASTTDGAYFLRADDAGSKMELTRTGHAGALFQALHTNTTAYSLQSGTVNAGGSSPAVTLYFNGVQAQATAITATPIAITGPAVVGADSNNNAVADYLQGDIAELIVYPSVLAGTDRQRVEDYLAAKYNLTLGRASSPLAAGSRAVWDGQNVLLDTDLSGVTQARYTDFPGEWGGLVSQRRGSASGYFGFDPQMSARILTSSAGSVTDVYGNKAFGEELLGSGTTMNPFRYEGLFGYYRDNASGLYVRARHLRPDLGRWNSRDPIGFAGGINLYEYVLNNPVVLVDPSGDDGYDANKVLRIAKSYNNSTRWSEDSKSEDSKKRTGCSGFVYSVLAEAGYRPHLRHPGWVTWPNGSKHRRVIPEAADWASGNVVGWTRL